MQLTSHFRLSELIVSETAERLGIDNTPNLIETVNLAKTAYLLQILRDAVYKKPIVVTSGFRAEPVNRAVGGVETSDHRRGEAADYRVSGWGVLPAAKAARDFLLANNIPFDQLIYEPSRGVIHISTGNRNRRQILTQMGGPGTLVTVGLPD